MHSDLKVFIVHFVERGFDRGSRACEVLLILLSER